MISMILHIITSVLNVGSVSYCTNRNKIILGIHYLDCNCRLFL